MASGGGYRDQAGRILPSPIMAVREVLVPGPFVPPVQRLAAFLGGELTAEPLVDGVAKALEAATAAERGA
jgi:hypothetical protein